jgi:cytochrome c-type biogenesis protein CcmH/NrfG
MFFPRLRKRAKWVFLFLAIAFMLAFVVAGVGSGFGSGFGDYLADLFNAQPAADVPSEERAREKLKENPNDSAANLELATALQTEGKTSEAIKSLERYTTLKPSDADALQQLAGLYLIQAGEAERRAQAAQIEGARAYFGNELQPTDSKIAEELGTDPITSYVQQQTTQAYSTAFGEAQAAYAKEAGIWERLTKLDAENETFFYELGRSAQQANDPARAIKGFEGYLELTPDATNAKQIRQIVKELKKQQAAGPVGGGG